MTKITKIISGAVVLSIVCLILVSVTKKNSNISSIDTIKIVGAFSLTGDVAVYGESDRDGAQLALDEINSAGGVNGKKLELLVQDTRSTAKDTVSAFTKLQSIDGAKYFIVSFLDSYPGAESLVKKDELLISPDAGVEVMNGTVMHENVFGTWYRTQPKSELTVKHIAQSGKKKLYLVIGNDGYYATVLKYTKEAAEKYGVEIVGVDLLGTNTDVKSILPKVKASGADTVFFSVLDTSVYVDFLKHKLGFLKDIAIYTDENATSYLGPDYVKDMEGVYFYTNKAPSQTFLDAYIKKFGHEPQITASVAYDSVYMMAEVMKINPKDIAIYMRSRSFDTVSYGNVTFDELGGIKTDAKYFVIKQVRSGKAVQVFQ